MPTEIVHKCGHRLGLFDSVDDHGSFEIKCPKCKEWLEIHIQLISNSSEDGTIGPYQVTYTKAAA